MPPSMRYSPTCRYSSHHLHRLLQSTSIKKWKMENKYIGLVRWRGYRFPYNVQNFVRWFPRTVKDTFDRGWKGYAACDTWDTDSYLSELIPNMLEHMLKYNHGWPTMMDELITVDMSSTPEEHDEVSHALWGAILTAIIDGFRSYSEIKYDFTREQYDEKMVEYELGFELFHEYYADLWD